MDIFLLLLSLIILSGLFSGSEIALITLSDAKVKALVASGAKSASSIAKLKSNPNKMLIAILLGNNLVNISASVVATLWTTETFGNQYLGYATGVLTLFILIFGEIFPKAVAQKYSVQFSEFIAPALLFLVYLMYPIVIVLEYLLFQTTKRFNVSDNLTKITEAKAMIEIVKECGDIEENIEKIIHNTFDFDTKCVETIMTPESQIVSISSKSTIKKLKKLFIETSRSRILVYEENEHNIIGVISTKMIIKLLHDKIKYIDDIKLDPPVIVNKNYHIDKLLIKFQESNQHIAIIKDEDKLIGLVTMENILEEIVGEIFDETQKNRKFIQIIDNNCFVVRYDTPMNELRKYIKDFEVNEQKFKSIETLFLEKINEPIELNREYNFETYLITPTKLKFGKILKFKICAITEQ